MSDEREREQKKGKGHKSIEGKRESLSITKGVKTVAAIISTAVKF